MPFTVEYAYFPYDILDDDVHKYDFSEVSFYEYLNSKNHLPIEFRRKLILVKCPKREANYLNIPIGTPVYLFEDIGRDKTGRIVEFVDTYTRTDQVKLTFNSYKEMDLLVPSGDKVKTFAFEKKQNSLFSNSRYAFATALIYKNNEM